MIEPRFNLYKQKSTFRCVHDVHQHFLAEMSPFHILVQKACYPHGCIYFKWKCRLLAKRKKCFRNFEKIGRECFNCRYFYEEKIHQYPEFVNNQLDFSDFQASFADFQSWVDSLKKRRLSVEGIVNFVSPELIIQQNNGIPFIRFTGFLVRYESGYIDNVPFEDPFYLRISSITQQQLKIRRGDKMDFMAQVEIDRGRFRFFKSGNFVFYERGENNFLLKKDVLERLNKCKIHTKQNAICLSCKHGILADWENINHGPSRSLICLEGVMNPVTCQKKDAIDKDDRGENCANPKWIGQGCHKSI